MANRGYVAPGVRVNDEDRAQWVDNDEYLYDLWRHSRLTSMRAFVRANRAEIDQAIASALNRPPAS